MASLVPYLFFNGNCREVMKFYEGSFGGKLELMTYGDAQGEGCPIAIKGHVMHSMLKAKELTLMASDSPDTPPQAVGGNVALSVHSEDLPEIEALFKALSDGGKVESPPQDTFWGAKFGTLTDRFGIHWMLNCQLDQERNR